MTTSVWPPRTRDRSALVHAYVDLLGWTLFVGSDPVQPGELEDAFTSNPNTVLLASCSSFDAVSIPYRAATEALIRLERKELSVPCLLSGERGIFLVEAGSGHRVAALGGVEVAAGDAARMILPPTVGARWDTPPWRRSERVPVKLHNTDVVGPFLSGALRLFSHSSEAGGAAC
ncbi:hypothetical protein [Streptomyces akebiae]|uniref:Uncharacterized protein n=1 Tax=Streptomyces akebiae TaxID=2865673 RepID=A0ABX8XXD0_9ACTN|nr:hypothetical protein [Streptomyces akebiae]QYX80247.1 hypothetical protein K1J60_30305 [Streptomyces akebiae]